MVDACGQGGLRSIAQHPIDAYGPVDVLDLLVAAELISDGELPLDLIVGRAGDDDAAGLGQPLQPVGDIDAVAMDVVALDNDVAEVDADAELDPLVRRHAGVSLCLGLLDLDRATQGVDHAGKLDQQAVAHGLDQASAVLVDLWLKQVLKVGLETGARTLFIALA